MMHIFFLWKTSTVRLLTISPCGNCLYAATTLLHRVHSADAGRVWTVCRVSLFFCSSVARSFFCSCASISFLCCMWSTNNKHVIQFACVHPHVSTYACVHPCFSYAACDHMQYDTHIYICMWIAQQTIIQFACVHPYVSTYAYACVVCLCMCMCTSCNSACMHACLCVCCMCTCLHVHIFFSICLCTHVSQMWKGQTCWQLTMCVCAQHKKKHNKHNKPSER